MRNITDRKKHSYLTLKAAVVLLSILALGCPSGRGQGLAPGEQAPEFSLPTLDQSRTISLDDLKGKVVLVNFWASWCGPCVEELPALERLYRKFADKGLVVLAVGIDDSQANLVEASRRFGLSYPSVVDLSGKIKSRYKISGVPESFLIGRDGRMVLFNDPDSNDFVVRMTGPREWDSPDMISRFSSMLSSSASSGNGSSKASLS